MRRRKFLDIRSSTAAETLVPARDQRAQFYHGGERLEWRVAAAR
jgi:hypothetical protein